MSVTDVKTSSQIQPLEGEGLVRAVQMYDRDGYMPGAPNAS